MKKKSLNAGNSHRSLQLELKATELTMAEFIGSWKKSIFSHQMIAMSSEIVSNWLRSLQNLCYIFYKNEYIK